MTKPLNIIQEDKSEALLGYALDLLDITTDKERKDTRNTIRAWRKVYNFPENKIDWELTKDQFERLQENLTLTVRILEGMSPFVRFQLLRFEDTRDVFLSEGDWETDVNP